MEFAILLKVTEAALADAEPRTIVTASKWRKIVILFFIEMLHRLLLNCSFRSIRQGL
jgi:hypothetical protein